MSDSPAPFDGEQVDNKVEEDEAFHRLEKEYAHTKIVTVVQRENEAPRVQWDDNLSQSEVVTCLFKALLSLTLDDYIMEMFDEFGGDDYDEVDDDRE